VSNFLKSIFGGKDKEDRQDSTSLETSEIPTQPYSPVASNSPSSKLKSTPTPFNVGIGSSIGLQRDHNEDSLYSMSAIMVSNSSNLPMGLYIVADGMGGHLHGEIASEVAVDTMAKIVIPKLLSLSLDNPSVDHAETVQDILSEGMGAAHEAILEQAPGGGSTLTGMLILGDHMSIAHIGDSRAYQIDSDGNSKVLTTDHSLVQRLQELGQISSDEAAVHPQRNVLYRALGQAEPVSAEFITAPVPASGYLVLCSDGLWGMISDAKMVEIITTAASPQQASQELVDAANTAGGPDNISVIIIELSG
jgi:serine/threonine protein phosphatase PrpC